MPCLGHAYCETTLGVVMLYTVHDQQTNLKARLQPRDLADMCAAIILKQSYIAGVAALLTCMFVRSLLTVSGGTLSRHA